MAKDKDEEGPDAAELEERLERLARFIRAAGHAQGLIPAQWDVLRYLARANSYSNSPVATAQYLGATKGTVSQTIQTLVKKGLVAAQARPGDQRSLALHLTTRGREMLAQDPLQAMAADIEALGGKTQRRFARAITSLVEAETARQNHALFGPCHSCRFLLHSSPPACASFGAVLEREALHRLCQRYRPVKPASEK